MRDANLRRVKESFAGVQPQFFFGKDSPNGQPPGTTIRRPPTAANRRQPPTAANRR